MWYGTAGKARLDGNEVLKLFFLSLFSVLSFPLSLFSSHEHEVIRVSYCDQSMSVFHRRRASSSRQQFPINDNSSYTTEPILTRLYMYVS